MHMGHSVATRDIERVAQLLVRAMCTGHCLCCAAITMSAPANKNNIPMPMRKLSQEVKV